MIIVHTKLWCNDSHTQPSFGRHSLSVINYHHQISVRPGCRSHSLGPPWPWELREGIAAVQRPPPRPTWTAPSVWWNSWWLTSLRTLSCNAAWGTETRKKRSRESWRCWSTPSSSPTGKVLYSVPPHLMLDCTALCAWWSLAFLLCLEGAFIMVKWMVCRWRDMYNITQYVRQWINWIIHWLVDWG